MWPLLWYIRRINTCGSSWTNRARYLDTDTSEEAIRHWNLGSRGLRSLLLVSAYTSNISLPFFRLLTFTRTFKDFSVSKENATSHNLKRVSTFEQAKTKLRTFHYRTIIYIISYHIMPPLHYFTSPPDQASSGTHRPRWQSWWWRRGAWTAPGCSPWHREAQS